MQKKLVLTLSFAFCFLSAGILNASIIVEFNSSPGAATVLNDANAGQDFTVSLGSGVANGTNLDFIGVSATSMLGTSFTFDAIISPAGNSAGISVAANNGSLVETGSTTQFSNGDGLIITISNISDPTVVLDGFTNFGTDFSGGGEGFTIGGVNYIRGTATNGDNDPRRGIVLPGGTPGNGAGQPAGAVPGLLAGSSAQVDFVGASVGLRGFAIQFSDVIPEPSGALLAAGFAVLGLLGRRRRR